MERKTIVMEMNELIENSYKLIINTQTISAL
jgi:hypothetical protein